MRKISLCMVVRNEEKHLRSCLESVKDIVDEIVIVDTGSNDSTKQIAEEFDARIFDFTWVDDFSAARNFALDQATGDWILILDADETLHPDDHQSLCDLGDDGFCDAYYFLITDAKDANKSFTSIRFFRNEKDFRYSGRIHEVLKIPIHLEKDDSYAAIDIMILHYGQTDQDISDTEKSQKNFEILQKDALEHPDNPRTIYYLGKEYDARNDLQKALDCYIRAFELDSSEKRNPSIIVPLIMLLEHFRDYSKALEYLDEAIARYEDYTDLYYLKGVMHFRSGDMESAMDSYEKCFELGLQSPLYPAFEHMGAHFAKRELATCFKQLGDLSTARDLYFEAMQDHPKDTICLRNLSDLLLKHHDKKLVKTEVEKIVDTNDPGIRDAMTQIFGHES